MAQRSARRVPSATLDASKLLVLAGALAVGVFFWSAPALRPLKLLVVMMHETGHAVASLVVGGRVERVTLSSDESGACLSALPPGIWRAILVYSMGYLGSAMAGAALLVATFRWGLGRPMLAGLCGWLFVMALVYARDLFTLFFCLGAALVLAIAARWLPLGAVKVVNLAVASFSVLYALADLRDDLWDSATRGQSDAQLLANVTFIPALVWAALWSLLAVGILAAGAVWALRAPRRGTPAEAVLQSSR